MRIVLLLIVAGVTANCFGQDLATELQHILKTYQQVKLHGGTKSIDLRSGTIIVYDSFSHKRTGTIDSDKGEITNGGFNIYYDIGHMAGAHMNETLRTQTGFYVDKMFNGTRTVIGLQKKETENELVLTFWGDDIKDRRFPANFRAIVKDKKEIQLMLDIAFSYQAKGKYNQ